MVDKVKHQKIYNLMAGDEILDTNNIKFIGSDERIRLAIGIRIAKYFEQEKVEKIEERVENLVDQLSIDNLLDLANDQELRIVLINKLKSEDLVTKNQKNGEIENENKQENKNNNDNDASKENDGNDEKDENNQNENNNNGDVNNNENQGIIVHSHTRGFNFEESNSENDQDSDVGNKNQNNQNNQVSGRTGNEMGIASGNVFVDDENNSNNNRNDGSSMGFGAGFDSNLHEKQIRNSGMIDERVGVGMAGSDSNGYGNMNNNTGNVGNDGDGVNNVNNVNSNMGKGNIISNISGIIQNSLLSEKVKLLKDKSKEITSKAVDNQAYTVNNPSMDNL